MPFGGMASMAFGPDATCIEAYGRTTRVAAHGYPRRRPVLDVQHGPVPHAPPQATHPRVLSPEVRSKSRSVVLGFFLFLRQFWYGVNDGKLELDDGWRGLGFFELLDCWISMWYDVAELRIW